MTGNEDLSSKMAYGGVMRRLTEDSLHSPSGKDVWR